MRENRVLQVEVGVLIALVLFLLFLLFGRHHTVTTVVSGGELSGGYAQTGDRIAFRTLYPGDPGYTVNFHFPYPCQDSDGKDITTLSVSGGKSTYCTVTAASGQQGSGVVFSYTITQGAGAVVEPSQNHKGNPGHGKEGEIYDSANPCKLCSPVVGGGDGDGAMGGDVKAKEMSSSNNVTATITCSNGTSGPAVVTPATVALGNKAELNWLAGGNWTASNFVPVPPSSGTACSDGNSFSSTGDYSYCKVKDPGTYTYSVHLDGCAKDGNNGSLTIQAAREVPIVLAPDRTEGVAGHTFTQGDMLRWRTLKGPTNLSYELSFDVPNPACNVPKGKVVTVTPSQSFSCQGMNPTDNGKAVHYKIVRVFKTPATNPPNPTPGPAPGPPPGHPPVGISVDSATPCKAC